MRALVSAAIGFVLLVAGPIAQAQKIVIDPGHGGTDPGGTGNGMQEKNIVLDVSLRFGELLQADSADAAGGGSWTVLYTRNNDQFVSLAGRASYANSQGADRFMSIHSNAFGDPSANGIETFSYTNGSQGAALRNLVQAEMLEVWPLTNRGNKTANFAVLRETGMPAELHELAFITNATDASYLGDPARRQQAAEAHLRAIQRHYGLDPYIPNGEATPQTGTVSGRVLDDLGGVAGADVALSSGASTITDGSGAYELADVAPGTYTLSVSAAGYESVDQSIEVVAGEVAAADVFISNGEGGQPGSDAGVGAGPNGDGDLVGAGCGCQSGNGGAGTGLFGALALIALVARRRRSR